MARFNVSKIDSSKKEKLLEDINERGFEKVSEFDLDNYKLTTFFVPSPSPTNIWWLEKYSQYFEKYKNEKNKIFSGLILAESKKDIEVIYLLAFGKTHFYVDKFIEYDFGLNLAEKIADDCGTKTKSTKKFAGNTSKSMVSFVTDSPLSFTSGEAAEYFKLKAKDKKAWGKSFIYFGNSVQFNCIKYETKDLPLLLDKIMESLKHDGGISLPRMIPIKDPDKIIELNNKLYKAISEDSSNSKVGIYDYELYGTDFVFSQSTHVRLKYEDDDEGNDSKFRVSGEILEELTLDDINDFVSTNNLESDNIIDKLKVQVFIDDRSVFTIKLIKLLEFVGDDNTFLYKGKWFCFNKSFNEFLYESVGKIPVDCSSLTFSKSEHNDWLKNHSDENIKYPERYLLDKLKASNPNYEIYDRELDYRHINGKTFSMEVGDIFDASKKSLIVAKIGSGHEFAYASNQALLALQQVINNIYKTEDGHEIEVRELNLYFASKNVNTPVKVTDVDSLNFFLQLSELQLIAQEKNVKLMVTFAKYSDEKITN